jgi:SAM-dependent methyltransferase
MSQERDYLLGTHDEEIARLGVQHRVWRPRALQAWMDAGFTTGQTIVDVGCGPGYAALDLAEITGPDGHVVAIDRSRRFLDALESRGLANVRTVEADLDHDELPEVAADGIWIRWVLAFVKHPKALLNRVIRLLKPGGTIVIHEYFDYSTWRLAPRSERFENFVATVMASWHADGGEPDIGLDLPQWLTEQRLEICRLKPIVDVVRRDNFVWQWPATFVEVGLARLVDLGRMTSRAAEETARDFSERAQDGRTSLITPAVLEIIARRAES